MNSVTILICMAALLFSTWFGCKSRQSNSELSSDRLYTDVGTNQVISEVFRGLNYDGDVKVAISPNGKILASVGANISDVDDGHNDAVEISNFDYRQSSVSDVSNGRVIRRNSVQSVMLWNAETLKPLLSPKQFTKLNRVSLKGIRAITFTTDSKGVAVCADQGVVYWPDVTRNAGARYFKASELGGRCRSIAIGNFAQKNQNNVVLDEQQVLAVGTPTSLYRIRLNLERPSPEPVCQTGYSFDAIQFMESSNGQNRYADAEKLIATSSAALEESRIGLVERRNRLSGKYGILPFATMRAKGRHSAGLRLGSGKKKKTVVATCESLMSGRFSSTLRNPVQIDTVGTKVIITARDSRYAQLFTVNGKELKKVSSNRSDFIVGTENVGGVPAAAMSPQYRKFNSDFIFTGQGDRTARLWKFNADGSRNLDLLSQVNVGVGNAVTSGQFLKHRPAVVFGDRGALYVWNFEKMLVPTDISSKLPNNKYSKIAIDDKRNSVWLGAENGSVILFDMTSAKSIGGFSAKFNSPVTDIQLSGNLDRSVVASGPITKVYDNRSDIPRLIAEPNLWDGSSSSKIVGYRFGSDNETLFSVNDIGQVRSLNTSNNNKSKIDIKLNDGERVVGFSVYPMNIKYRKLVSRSKDDEAEFTRSVEIHPVLAPLIYNSYGQSIPNPFQIYGEKSKEKIEAILSKRGQGSQTKEEPKPSPENPDLISGSKQTPQQKSDQQKADQSACAGGQCSNTTNVESSIASMDDSEEIKEFMHAKPEVINSDIQHLKVAVLTNSGRVIMSDLTENKSWNIEYRKAPILGFSGYFQQIYRNAASASLSDGRNYLTQSNGYHAKEIQFDDDGGCMMVVLKSGLQFRCIPILQSTAKNTPSISVLSSKPKREFLDPWIVYNSSQRVGHLKFGKFFKLAIVGTDRGEVLSYDVNRYRLFPFSRRQERLGYSALSTNKSPISELSASISGNFAAAIHADNRVRIHWIDQAFELPLLNVSTEEMNELRDFAN